jgi:hypothetical protein
MIATEKEKTTSWLADSDEDRRPARCWIIDGEFREERSS